METGRRGGDAERAGPIPRVWRLRMRREISAAEVTPEERGVPAPHQAPQPGTTVQERQVLMTSDCDSVFLGLRPRKTEQDGQLLET